MFFTLNRRFQLKYAVWTLILTAPIHCIGEHVMEWRIFTNLLRFLI